MSGVSAWGLRARFYQSGFCVNRLGVTLIVACQVKVDRLILGVGFHSLLVVRLSPR